MEAIKTIEHNGFTIELYYAEDTENPREWGNLGTLYSNHRDYNWDGFGIEDLIEKVNGDIYADTIPWDKIAKDYYFQKVWIYEHSGVALAVGDKNPFGVGYMAWDSGLLGVLAVEKSKACKEFGYKRPCKALREKIEKSLGWEIETLDKWARGEVYGFISRDKFGEEIDSCWGFYSQEEAIQEAIAALPKEKEVKNAA